jgi:hypothetical protein
MGLDRQYRLKCDGYGIVHNSYQASRNLREARAKAQRGGWGRRKVVVEQYQARKWKELPNGKWAWDGVTMEARDRIGVRDFCPRCLEQMKGQREP